MCHGRASEGVLNPVNGWTRAPRTALLVADERHSGRVGVRLVAALGIWAGRIRLQVFEKVTRLGRVSPAMAGAQMVSMKTCRPRKLLRPPSESGTCHENPLYARAGRDHPANGPPSGGLHNPNQGGFSPQPGAAGKDEILP